MKFGWPYQKHREKDNVMQEICNEVHDADADDDCSGGGGGGDNNSQSTCSNTTFSTANMFIPQKCSPVMTYADYAWN